MPPRSTVVRSASAGEAFRQSLEELDALEVRTRTHGTAKWRRRIRDYPFHRGHIMEAADGLASVQKIVHTIVLPAEVAAEEISWTAVHVLSQGKGKTQTQPRNIWRENTRNLWYSALVPMTDYWERVFSEDAPGEPEARRQLDDLTTAAEMLGLILFPDRFDRLY